MSGDGLDLMEAVEAAVALGTGRPEPERRVMGFVLQDRWQEFEPVLTEHADREEGRLL